MLAMTMRIAPRPGGSGAIAGNAQGAGTLGFSANRRPTPGTRIAAMTRAIIIVAAAIAAIGMMVAALWAWAGAPDMVADWDVLRPDQMLWAIRSGAIAAAALAQVVIFGVVAGQIFPRRNADQAIVIVSAAIFAIALIAAVMLGIAGR
jgi:hypothetical protein